MALFAYQAYGFIPILITKHRQKFSKVTNLLMLASIGLMAYAVLLQAGRTFFIVSGILAFACFVCLSRSDRRDMFRDAYVRLGCLMVILLGGAAIFIIGTQRVNIIEIQNTLNGTEYRYFESFFLHAQESSAYFVTVTLHYLAGPWNNLNILFQSDVGVLRLSYGPLENVIGRFLPGQAFTLHPDRAETLRNYINNGGQLSGWRTGFGNVLIWYGWLGLFPFTYILAFVMGRTFRLARASGSLFHFCQAAWVFSVFYMCAFYFPSDSIFWINLTLFFLMIPFLATYWK
ncbi:MAG: hypothetical protein AAGA71_06120 [Pseudomonadota bacterium]